MTGPIRHTPVGQAENAQNRASDPAASVWVSANAGTGKTRVLTNRILRLLLDGARITDILAVTYTRAAAAEMRNRLFEKLAGWAVMPENDLTQSLIGVGIASPTPRQHERARRLFATMLDAPQPVRIETVHAFAQSVLRRFPVEAGLQPWFEIATTTETASLKQEAEHRVLRAANNEVADAVAELARYHGETTLIEQFGALIAGSHGEVLARLRRDPQGFRRALFGMFDAQDFTDDPDGAIAELLVESGNKNLRPVAEAMMASASARDSKRGEAILNWLDCGQDSTARKAAWDSYCAAFLTQKGEVAKTIATKKVEDELPGANDILRTEANRVRGVAAAIHGCETARQSFPLLVLADAIAREYGAAKTRQGLLDYDDLIRATKNLLTADGGVGWVRYKLDRGINYLLVDEAQDTSPEQWQILSTLAEEFFTGDATEPDSAPPRSLFSVGDFKQSIYSFQGAAPRLFREKEKHFGLMANAAQKPFERVDLNVSFRSTAPVLRLVDSINAPPSPLPGIDDATNHELSRIGHGGFVELLDCTTAEEDEDAELLHARRLAGVIKSWVGKRNLPARGRTVTPGDILVLVRKRGRLPELLDRELNLAGLPVAGADRIRLNRDIAVLDLIALGRVMLLPRDDLTLASVLKSPLFGLTEDDIFRLAHNREGQSIFERMAEIATKGDDATIARAHETLTGWLALHDTATPYDFFRRVLDGGLRRAFSKRLGNHVRDVLAEFLEVARQYEKTRPASMLGFLEFMEDSDAEIVRESGNRLEDEIRIMTIHGAKGLEAPIVVLPDTLRSRTPTSRLVELTGHDDFDGMTIPVLPASNHLVRHEAVRDATESRRARDMEEENRLFYVALTRAEDGVLAAGFTAPRSRFMENSWYEKLQRALEELEAVTATDDDGNKLLRLTNPQKAEPSIDTAPQETDGDFTPPDWATTPPATEEVPPRPLAPSRMEAEVPSSPVGAARMAAMERGTLAHRMLEILPQLEGDARAHAASRLVAHATAMNETIAREVLAEVEALLAREDLAALFGPGSRAEVPVAGMVGEVAVEGIIDRLVVNQDTITIIDFKTGRPPEDESKLPPQYLRQLALYRELLVQIWPGREVRAGLVFTENARLYWADSADLRGFAAEFRPRT